ncbi:MAG: hypothetical protein WCE45_04215 [Sedimentisphaerales bacterium]
MVKTLRITTILIAVAALGIIIFIAAKGIASDKGIEKFLAAPGIAEQLAGSAEKGAPIEQDTPLIRQAKAFALRINPPPPPEPVRRAPTPEELRPKAAITAKFTLVGTSYYAGNEKSSWALINEVGKGWHWVREGEKIGYLVIEKIGMGAVLIRDGDKTYELTAESQQKPDYVTSFTGEVESKAVPDWQGKESNQSEAVSTDPNSVSSAENVQPELGPEPTKEEVQDNINWLKQLQENPETLGMTSEEANELKDLGEILKSFETQLQNIEANEPNAADKSNSPNAVDKPKEPNAVGKPSPAKAPDANEKQPPKINRPVPRRQEPNQPEGGSGPREPRRIRRTR